MALISALIFLGVSMLLGLSIMLTTSSDVFVSGSMRNSKTAFYAADAGVSVMRTALVNALKAATPASVASAAATAFPCADPAFNAAILQAALVNAGNGSAQTLSSYSNYGDSSSSFVIDTTVDGVLPRTSFKCTNMQSTAQPPPAGQPPHPWTEFYTFGYQVTSNGTAGGPAFSTVVEQGTITYNINVNVLDASSSYQNILFSFAGYGMFIDNYDPHNGSTLLHGTITGRVHTNGEWGFSTGSPNYVFTDAVSSHSQNAYFLFNGSTGFDSNSASYTYTTGNGKNRVSTTLAPQFNSGFTRGVDAIPLPSNSNSQSRAVIDGAGFDINNPLQAPPAPTTAELAANLRNANGTPFGGGTGVYVPVQVVSDDQRGHVVYGSTGAGIYVNGNVDDMRLDASTPGLQVYTIIQGGTTTTVTYNLTPNPVNGFPPISTTVNNGTTSMTSRGLPTNVYPVNPNRPAAIQPLVSVSLYVNGRIDSLHGPLDQVTGQSLPAVQDRAAMTITATGSVTVTGDLIYATRPVTMAQGQVAPGVPANSPPGTLIPGNDNGQALGIYTATGNIYLDVSNIQSRNIEIDASMATLSSGGTGGITVANNGVNANTINIIGGRIQNNIYTLGNTSTVRNVLFDRRYANSSYAPPFFPNTSAAVVNGSNLSYNFTVDAPASSLRAFPTSYTVPSRLVTAANEGH